MIHIAQATTLPDGTPATVKGSLCIIENTYRNAKKLKLAYPDVPIPSIENPIKIVSSVAREVYA